MKSWIKKIINNCKSFLAWVWSECKNWHTLVLLAIVCIGLSLPVWGGYLLGFLFHWEWAFWIATVMWGFWLLPGAPFFALAVSITLAIKRIHKRITEKKAQQLDESEVTTEEAQSKPTDSDQPQPPKSV